MYMKRIQNSGINSKFNKKNFNFSLIHLIGKSELKSNFKSKMIHEKLSNENIYKSDIKYQINRNLNFENAGDEENAHRDIGERFSELTKILLPIVFMRYTYFSLDDSSHCSLTFISLMLVGFGICLSWSKNNKDKTDYLTPINKNDLITHHRSFMIRMILEMLFFIHTFSRVQYSDKLFYKQIAYFNIVNLVINIILDISIFHSGFFFFIQGLGSLSFLHYSENFIVIRFFKNLFSFDLFINLFIAFTALMIQYSIRNGLRELWALYDSFKRSYFIFKKSLFDDFCYPVFVISKKINNSYTIFYKNQKSEDLIQTVKIIKNKSKFQGNTCTGILDSSGKVSLTKSNFSRKNIMQKAQKGSQSSVKKDQSLDEIFFDSEMEKLFDTELKKLVEKKNKFFDFPLKCSDRKKSNLTSMQGSGKLTYFDGDMDNYDWFRVVVSPCVWKNQDAFYIQFIRNTDYYKGDLISKATCNLSNELSVLVEDVDKVCGKLIDYEMLTKEKLCLGPSMSQKNVKNSPGTLNQSESSGKLSSETLKKISLKKQTTMMNRLGNTNTTNSNSSTKDFGISHTSPAQMPHFDYAIWFFFKYSLNFIYDMILTIKVHAYLVNKIIFTLRFFPKTKIKQLMNYMVDYFLIPSRLKNVKFNVNFNLLYDEISCNPYYLRCIVFNIMLFIIHNSSDVNKEKVVDINIKSEKEFPPQSSNNLLSQKSEVIFKFDIQYKDEKPKINFNTLYQILMNRSKTFIDFRKDLEKMKILDLGILTVYYLVNLVFDNDLVLKTDNDGTHTLSFYIKSNVSDRYDNNNAVEYPFMKFKEPKKVFEQHYTKILHRVFKINPPACLEYKNNAVKGYLGKIESNNDLKKCFPSVKGIKKGVAKDDSECEEHLIFEDIDISIENDKNMVKETNYTLSKHFENYEKLISAQEEKEQSLINTLYQHNIRFLSPLIPNSYSLNANIKRIKMEGESKTKLRYFYPPRFLIVEDNAFGRISLIENLKKQKLIYLIDIAAFGWESIQKFKFFLNKGYMYDIIFMDINLADMKGSVAAKKMRQLEQEYGGIRTNIVAVSVEGQKNVMVNNIFDGYCKFLLFYKILNIYYSIVEKPIKGDDFPEYIAHHFKKNRPEVKYNS